ncbi:unnamed protein product [Rotaria magnacalcarata]|uniref:Uncharacterized protein n=1 Tax=Rotaria magnacalcarata TaxID=392030 RepID=A0A815Q6L9_9BILA|nr:unnamed protein product [Rotaria magnacalcarata]CAF1457748.1 unnamed protein product [Rotaria magnacalcarata]CAF2147400.1 unnamed protein product [Rotaria magnacalcarata]CAF4110988.1 unnamed protein product [Rotaria magnacalcarata]CAF4146791.1 unnamed protein product [Rotaria magnacalcarata]
MFSIQTTTNTTNNIPLYTTAISKSPPTAHNINDNEDFPSLTKINLNYSSNMHIQINDVLKEKMLEIIEQAIQKIYEALSQKFEQLTKRLLVRIAAEYKVLDKSTQGEANCLAEGR